MPDKNNHALVRTLLIQKSAVRKPGSNGGDHQCKPKCFPTFTACRPLAGAAFEISIHTFLLEHRPGRGPILQDNLKFQIWYLGNLPTCKQSILFSFLLIYFRQGLSGHLTKMNRALPYTACECLDSHVTRKHHYTPRTSHPSTPFPTSLVHRKK